VTKRSDEFNVDSGWQLDGRDPYTPSPNDPAYTPPRFTAGNDLTMQTVDYPAQSLTGPGAHLFVSSEYIDDQFWMYVVYFAGDDPTAPVIQRPLGRLSWNWGGLVVFDWNGSQFIHRLRYPTATATTRTGEPTTSMVTLQGVLNKTPVACPGGPPLTENHVDSSRVLVWEYYFYILGRSPDAGGWDWHTSQIAQCQFDLGCNIMARSNDALGFFFSQEFKDLMAQLDYEMTHPPGDPNFNAPTYNHRFVYWCYKLILQREPDQGGWQYWEDILNATGDYGWIIHGFIYSNEYRNERPHF
jgi:hypothetical protein